MKSSSEMTMSRSTGKPRNGSTRIGPGTRSRRKALQVSCGVPLTIIPQLPQTPIRHDQR